MVALSSTFIATVLSLSVFASAYDTAPASGIQVQRIRRSSAQHGHALHRRAPSTIPKRCKVKGAKPASVASISTGKKPTSKNSGGSNSSSSSDSDPDDDGSSSSNSGSSSGGSVGHHGGTIGVSGGSCAVDASSRPTKESGPNGSIGFLNCGIDGGGWNPPNVQVSDLVVKPLAEAGSAFSACKPYMHIFQAAADKYGLPDILLAAVAMQESSCQRNEQGQGGEQGIMQISKDKCQGRSLEACREPSFNIDAGASFLARTIKDNGGNVVKSMGEYNGWFPGLTRAKATHAAKTDCCRCQNNLDYLQTLFNGWLQGIDPSSLQMGKYFNLEVCE